MIVKNVQTECTHCGLPVPPGLLDSNRQEQFCCRGCSAAWQLIHSNGLDSFYRMSAVENEKRTLQNRSSDQFNSSGFTEFDEPEFHEKFARTDAGGSRIQLGLDGIHCAACVWLIEKLPTFVDGILSIQVNWTRRTVAMHWQPNLVRLSEIAFALHRLGYTPHPIRQNQATDRRQIENRRQLVAIGVAAAAAGNNMMIAAALYLGMYSYMSIDMETLFRVVSCIVGIFSLLVPGRIFLRGALNALKTKTPHMDLPIALGLTVGSVAGLVNTVRGTGEIYFDSLSVLICLLLIGRWIQFRQQNRAADAVELLYRLTPQRARKIEGNCVIDVSANTLQVNDVIQVRPGDLLASDGVVTSGQSFVDESILTGESQAVRKSVGDNVSAGTLNSNSLLEVRVTASGPKTRIHNILELVADATSAKPRIVQLADQISGYFVCIVLLLACMTFLAWMLIAPERAVDRAVALLVIACPCALAMATPLAVAVALGRLAKRKILVKSGDVLQSLNCPGAIWLDKTGTLTQGKMNVTEWIGEKSWLPLIAEVESRFNHPIASALIKFASDPSNAIHFGDSHQCQLIGDAQSHFGGVSAHVNGELFLIGNRNFLQTNGVCIENIVWDSSEARIVDNLCTPCWFAFAGEVVGMAGIGDSIRPESKAVVTQLKQSGWKVGILSGDQQHIVESVAQQLGIEIFHAGVSPEQKLSIIGKSMDVFDTTVMVGDGVNDSAALAAATVGIAVKGGAEASLAAAPVYFGSQGLSSICDLLKASRSTSNTIRLNFIASLAFNIIGITLAVIGWLDPLVAAILMPISSLTVLALSANAAAQRQP